MLSEEMNCFGQFVFQNSWKDLDVKPGLMAIIPTGKASYFKSPYYLFFGSYFKNYFYFKEIDC